MNLDSDFLNPVFLRDTRQMFHSRVILVVMGILLLLELGQLCVMPFLSDILDEDLSEKLGMVSFILQLVVINVLCLFCLVVSQTVAFSRERQIPDLDWSRMTVLSPFTIILGKLYCAMCTVCLIYAIAGPFLYIAYFMRGISQGQMALTVCCLLVQQVLVAMLCILLGALGRKNIEALATMGGLAILITFGVQNAIFTSGYFRSRYVTMYLVNNILIVLAISGLLFAIAVAVLTPSTGNVMYWPRLYLGCLPWTVPILGFGLLHILPKHSSLNPCFWVMSLFLGILALSTCLLSCVACFDRMEPGCRVMTDRPKNRLRRFFRFLFSSGRAGGILQCWLMTLTICLAFCAIVYFFPKNDMEPVTILFGIPFFFLFYLHLSSCLVQFIPSLKPLPVFFVVIILLLVFPLMGYGLSFHYFEENQLENRWLLLTTPFCLRPDDFWGISIGACLATVTGVPLLSFVFSHAREFIFGTEEKHLDKEVRNA